MDLTLLVEYLLYCCGRAIMRRTNINGSRLFDQGGSNFEILSAASLGVFIAMALFYYY